MVCPVSGTLDVTHQVKVSFKVSLPAALHIIVNGKSIVNLTTEQI